MAAPRRSTIVLIVALCAALAAVIAGTYAPRAKPAGRSGPGPIAMDTPLGATEVERDIAQLIAEYLTDEPAADRRYRSRTVAVSGVVLGVDRRDPQLVTVVVGKQPGSKESHCACQGGPRLDQAAGALSLGQRVTVRGKFAGMLMMRMVLLNCELVAR